MTDQEINIAIAECCGWTEIVMVASSETNGYEPVGVHPENRGKSYALTNNIPNYTSDLNAMHEAEKVFDDQPVDTKSMYWDYLCLCSMPEPFPGDDTFLRDYVMIRATARQRAEAFLRTLGKWKE